MASTGRLERWTAGDRTIVALVGLGLLLTVALGAITGSGRSLPSRSICVSVVAFGQECPGCGLTRSFAAMGHGDFTSARALNPLAPVLLAAAIALLLVRVAKLFIQRFDRWHTVDLILAAAVLVAMIARSVQFYFF